MNHSEGMCLTMPYVRRKAKWGHGNFNRSKMVRRLLYDEPVNFWVTLSQPLDPLSEATDGILLAWITVIP